MLFRRRVPIAFVALLLAFGGILTACGGSDDSIKADLGVVLTLSGPSSIYGLSSQKGIELALAEINDDHKVKGVTIGATIKDDAGDGPTAAKLFQEFIDAKVDAIAGPTLSNSAFTSDPLAVQAGLPVLAISNTATGITEMGDTIFRIPLAEANVAPKAIEVAVPKLGLKTAALLWANDEAFAKSTADLMRQAAATSGLQIVVEQQFSTNDTDFANALAAVQQAHPDTILIAALSNPTVAIATQARAMGLQQQVICGNQCNSAAFLTQAGPAAEGLIVGATWNIGVSNDASTAFVDAYRKKFNSDPDQFAAQAYTAIYVLADALKRAGGADPAKLRDALAATKDLSTPLGAFSFDPNREPLIQPAIQIVKDGSFALFQ